MNQARQRGSATAAVGSKDSSAKLVEVPLVPPRCDGLAAPASPADMQERPLPEIPVGYHPVWEAVGGGGGTLQRARGRARQRRRWLVVLVCGGLLLWTFLSLI